MWEQGTGSPKDAIVFTQAQWNVTKLLCGEIVQSAGTRQKEGSLF